MSNYKSSFNILKLFCENENFKGYDPFDGLNSKLFIFFKLNKILFFTSLLSMSMEAPSISAVVFLLAGLSYNNKKKIV